MLGHICVVDGIGILLKLMLYVDSLDINPMVEFIVIFVVRIIYMLGSVAYRYNRFNAPQDSSFVYGYFNCYGSEKRLTNCRMYSYWLRYCYSSYIAGVSCRGKENIFMIASVHVMLFRY